MGIRGKRTRDPLDASLVQSASRIGVCTLPQPTANGRLRTLHPVIEMDLTYRRKYAVQKQTKRVLCQKACKIIRRTVLDNVPALFTSVDAADLHFNAQDKTIVAGGL